MTLQKLGRYERIKNQLMPLYQKVTDPVSRMASAAALLHGKFSYFYWVGFYRLIDGRLLVGPYQGTLACMELAKDTGVCWHGVNTGKSEIVPDVHAFCGHIACDAKSKSEIVVPVRDARGEVVAVLDVDSSSPNSFDEEDRKGLELIAEMIYTQ